MNELDVQKEKDEVVHNILQNNYFDTDSDIYQYMHNLLLTTLPLADLYILGTLINCKTAKPTTQEKEE